MRYVKTALDDADVILFMAALEDKNDYPRLVEMVIAAKAPVIFLINKIDQNKGSQTYDKHSYWKALYPDMEFMTVSALENEGVELLKQRIIELLPDHPAYFPENELADKSERFICSEIIREKIFINYQQEIPYSCEVVVNLFREEESIIHVAAEIFVERDSQKGILIGKKGTSLKRVGVEARADMETFFGKKINLKTFVKVEKDWRRSEYKLKRFGYLS